MPCHLQIELLSSHQNGTATVDCRPGEREISSSSGSSKSYRASIIRGMWKKAFKGLKSNKDKEKPKQQDKNTEKENEKDERIKSESGEDKRVLKQVSSFVSHRCFSQWADCDLLPQTNVAGLCSSISVVLIICEQYTRQASLKKMILKRKDSKESRENVDDVDDCKYCKYLVFCCSKHCETLSFFTYEHVGLFKKDKKRKELKKIALPGLK